MNRCERDEAKKKHDSASVVRNKLNDEMMIELSIEVDRKIVEIDTLIRSDLIESNELSLCKRDEGKQKHDASSAVRKKLNDDLKI